MTGIRCHSSFSSCHYPNLSLKGIPDKKLPQDILDTSPRVSYQSIPSSAELMEEISKLEDEIVHLESHLLSLYRSAFEKHVRTVSYSSVAHIQHKPEFLAQYIACNTVYLSESEMQRTNTALHDQISCSRFWVSSGSSSCVADPKGASKRDQKSSDSGHRSLADHLGDSCIRDILTSPDRLSENITRCISSIYCKFSESLTQVVKEDNGPRDAKIEIMKVHLDDSSFNYAATMFQKVRSMVQCLEKIEPRKMKREGKLAFWINIHNALVMHAYLACGTHNRVKDTSIFKAAYNIGGHWINAYTIQSSILGIRPHYSASWLQTMLSSKKSNTVNVKHIYAIEYPEPLVHFALCSGAHSDPAVRVYTAKNIFQELKLAKEEFIQTSVHIYKESKVLLPKVLYYFAKDMSLTIPGLMKVVDGIISEDQQIAIKSCMKGRPEKYIQWLPHSSTFRYMIHEDLATEISA